ncbi:sensor histidine kinase [Brachybacterium sp. DNPG3]
MTIPAPSLRSARAWAIALGQTLLCLLLGLLTFLISFGMELEVNPEPAPALLTMFGLDALVGIAVSLAVGPLRFTRAGRVHSAVHLVIAMAAGMSTWSLPAAAVALYRLGLRRRMVLDIGALLLVGGMSMTTLTIDAEIRGDSPRGLVLTTFGVMLVSAAVPLLTGHVIGTRRELLRSLQARAASADREREAAELARAAAEREAEALVREHDADAARVRAEERTALARDVHDSISHHLAAIAMHAGALSYRDDLSPEDVRRAALTVRDAAQQANQELRSVLLTLRTVDGDDPLATAPTLLTIIERCRADGQDVTLTWDGITPEDLAGRDRSTVVALARVLTEVTTNAAKHAPGSPLAVRIARAPDPEASGAGSGSGAGSEAGARSEACASMRDRVVLTARNPLADDAAVAPSTGHGLLGVRERTRLLGGDATHRVRAGTFEVEAWVPW